MKTGQVILIPNTLGGEELQSIVPVNVIDSAISLRHFAVEDIKSARRLLRKMDRSFPIDDCQFFIINKNTTKADIEPCIHLLKQGHSIGIISEAGCAGIADPGAILVAAAHRLNSVVKPTVGPSSILLTLIGSGFNGQQFRFHGYLPKDQKERIKKIKDMENSIRRTGETQLFMDTPFRNMHVLDDLLNHLMDDTELCIASNLTLIDEQIKTRTIKDWREFAYDLSKKPTLFALGRSQH